MNDYKQILENQKNYFTSGATLNVNERISKLKKLYNTIEKYEDEINVALKNDLGKCSFESYMSEIGLVKSEISYFIKHGKSLSKKRKVHTPASQFLSNSYVLPSPYGNALIISPWNYPFLLSIEPLVDAVIAGNTVILKPSEYSPDTSSIIKKIIDETFRPEEAYVALGDADVSKELLNLKYDIIFFTGSKNVGQIILNSTIEHLTPCVLELGGKSPCIIDDTANLKLAARRIVFGKFLNCGQTCVAPDYLLCQKDIKEEQKPIEPKQVDAKPIEVKLNTDDLKNVFNDFLDNFKSVMPKHEVVKEEPKAEIKAEEPKVEKEPAKVDDEKVKADVERYKQMLAELE